MKTTKDDDGAILVVAPIAPTPVIDGALQGEHPERVTPGDELTREPTPPTVHLHRRTRFLDAVGDFQLKTGVGTLRKIIIGTAPAGMTGVLTVRDGQQGGGRVIAVLTPPVAAMESVELDAAFEKGLFVNLAGAVPGSWTITYE